MNHEGVHYNHIQREIGVTREKKYKVQ